MGLASSEWQGEKLENGFSNVLTFLRLYGEAALAIPSFLFALCCLTLSVATWAKPQSKAVPYYP